MLNFFKRSDGNSAVEFAIIGPVLVTMFIGVVWGGYLVKSAVQMQNAVEAGALYAINNSSDSSGINTVVNGATTMSGVTVTTSFYYECANGTQMSAGSTCADGSVLAKYIQITATKNINTIVTFPGIANPFPLTRTSTMRVQ